MLTDKMKEKMKEITFVLELSRKKYKVEIFDKTPGAEVVYFIFPYFRPDEDYDIPVMPFVALQRNIINIVARVEKYLDYTQYNQILPVLNDLNSQTVIKYYINPALTKLEAVFSIINIDFNIPDKSNTEYILNILSQIERSFSSNDIIRKVFQW